MVYAVSVAVLVTIFVLATLRPISLGLLAFVAAFAVGTAVSDIPLDKIQSFFPGDLFFTVLGITLLFGMAQVNGTIDLLLQKALVVVRGKRWAVAWMMFVIAAALMSFGAVLAVGMLAPIAMPLAKRFGIKPLLMSAMLGHGALGAAFSPITVYSVSTRQLVEDQGFSVSPSTLFLVPFGLNLLLAVVAFLVLGRDLFGKERAESTTVVEEKVPVPVAAGASGESARNAGTGAGGADTGVRAHQLSEDRDLTEDRDRTTSRITPAQCVTLAAIAAMLAAAFYGVEVGIAGTCLGVLLLLFMPGHAREAMSVVGWPAVLLVCGVMTYMEVLTSNGTIRFLGDAAMELPSVLLTSLVLLLAVALLSCVGSSFGLILIALPLAAPLLSSGDLPPAAFVIALSFCATVVDVSPFSSNGVLVLSSAQVEDKPRFQRQMLVYSGYICLVGTLLAWGLLILPTSW
ncbi:SLC13 family permease [Streptomyces mutabilis]|uniref:SLC13 family permease n=1 Tax=Streptomyces mutabilis TaxID=67332 RepID=UPI0033A0B5A3